MARTETTFLRPCGTSIRGTIALECKRKVTIA